jgi:hypothetical protein
MIKALEPTLAPFFRCEKPQVSPRLAASFITDARCGDLFCGVGSSGAANGADLEVAEAVELCLFLLSFSPCSGAELSPRRSNPTKKRAALPARNYAAYIHSTPVPAIRFVETVTFLQHFPAGRPSRSMLADVHGCGPTRESLPKT